MKLKFEFRKPDENSLKFEEIYDENLQYSLEDKLGLSDQGTQFVYMKDLESGQDIGECYFIPLDNMENWEPDEEQPIDGLTPYYGKRAMYVYSNTILPEYQNKGFGTILKSFVIGHCEALGYNLLVGHAKENGSIQLNERFGAERIEKFDNWYQTGESVILYKTQLCE